MLSTLSPLSPLSADSALSSAASSCADSDAFFHPTQSAQMSQLTLDTILRDLPGSVPSPQLQINVDHQAVISLYNHLASLIRSPQQPQQSSFSPSPSSSADMWSDAGFSYHYYDPSHTSYAAAAFIPTSRDEAHRKTFTRSLDACHVYRLSTIIEFPSPELRPSAEGRERTEEQEVAQLLLDQDEDGDGDCIMATNTATSIHDQETTMSSSTTDYSSPEIDSSKRGNNLWRAIRHANKKKKRSTSRDSSSSSTSSSSTTDTDWIHLSMTTSTATSIIHGSPTVAIDIRPTSHYKQHMTQPNPSPKDSMRRCLKKSTTPPRQRGRA